MATPLAAALSVTTVGVGAPQVLETRVKRFRAAVASGTNRGIGSVSEAAAPAAALKAGGVAAKLRFTVAVPGGGKFCAEFAVNEV